MLNPKTLRFNTSTVQGKRDYDIINLMARTRSISMPLTGSKMGLRDILIFEESKI